MMTMNMVPGSRETMQPMNMMNTGTEISSPSKNNQGSV